MFEGLVTYSKIKRMNRGYVTHYAIKLTLENRTIVIGYDHSITIKIYLQLSMNYIWEVSNYNGPIITDITVFLD